MRSLRVINRREMGGSIAAGRTIDQEAVDVTTKRLWLEVAVGVSVLMNV